MTPWSPARKCSCPSGSGGTARSPVCQRTSWTARSPRPAENVTRRRVAQRKLPRPLAENRPGQAVARRRLAAIPWTRSASAGHRGRGYRRPGCQRDVERTPEISWLIEPEEASAPDFPENAARRVEGLKLGSYRPERMPVAPGGPPCLDRAFGPGAALSIVTVGSFVVRGRDILNVRCDDDVGVRRRTLLERIDFCLPVRASPDRAGTAPDGCPWGTGFGGAAGQPQLRICGS